MAETAVETDKSAGKKQRKAAVKAARQAEAAPPRPAARGKGKGTVPDGGPTFWQKQAAIQKDDWGTRAHVYLYRTEPIIDRTRGGGSTTFVEKYAEPVTEERVLADYGSGRYKLLLNFRKPGAEQGDEIDSIYIDLFNLKYPPKVAAGEWVDDPRNKKWAWAKKHFPEEARGNVNDTILDALEIAEKLRPNTDPVKSTLDTIKAVRELSPPPARSATEELNTLVSVAEKLRPPETVPAFMQAQFTAMQAQITATQERYDKLMDKLIDARTAKRDDGNGFSVVKEVIGGVKDLLPEVKGLFPGLSIFSEDGGGGRTRMNGWQEFALGMAPHLAPWITPFAGVIAQVMAFRMQQAAQQPAPQPGHPAAPPAGAQPTRQQNGPAGLAPPAMMPFLQMIANPMLNFARDMAPPSTTTPAEAGAALAEWVYNGFGESDQYVPAVIASRAMGPVGVVAAFRAVPELWTDKGPRGTLPSLAEMEPQLPGFFQAFLDWEPETDDEPEETDPAQPEVVNFDQTYSSGV